MPDHSRVRRLQVLTAVTAAATLAICLLQTPSVSASAPLNVLGFVGFIGVLATIGFAWVLVDAVRSVKSNPNDHR